MNLKRKIETFKIIRKNIFKKNYTSTMYTNHSGLRYNVEENLHFICKPDLLFLLFHIHRLTEKGYHSNQDKNMALYNSFHTM